MLSDPERYRELLATEARLWEESWQKLIASNTQTLQLSVDEADLLDRVTRIRSKDAKFFEERLVCSDRIGLPALQILIRSPFDDNKYFKAVKITSAETCINWYARLHDPDKSEEYAPVELAAYKAFQDKIPQFIGQYIIAPSVQDVLTTDAVLELARRFIQTKVSAEYFSRCEIVLIVMRQLDRRGWKPRGLRGLQGMLSIRLCIHYLN